MTKSCSNKNCKQINPQPLENFYFRSDTQTYRSECKSCFLKVRKESWKRPEIKNKRKDTNLKKTYGINFCQYNEMLSEQQNCCAICKINISCVEKSFAVDHDHSNGQVRGLLCRDCNVGLGGFKDNIQFLNKAIEYLKFYGEKNGREI